MFHSISKIFILQLILKQNLLINIDETFTFPNLKKYIYISDLNENVWFFSVTCTVQYFFVNNKTRILSETIHFYPEDFKTLLKYIKM